VNRRIDFILLSLFPLLFFILEYIFRIEYSYYYLSVYDPAYAYIFNGLNFANLKLVTGFTGHPGIPLQILISIIIRITYLFRENGGIVNDVLLNPELYLNNISLVLVTINTFIIFLAGYLICNWFKNLAFAILIQLSVFFSKAAMFFASIVMAEPMLIFTELIIILYIFRYLQGNDEKALNKYSILFGVISGFGLAVKVAFFPVVLIPFLLIKGIKNRVRFILAAGVAFLVFMLPAMNRFERFVLWIKRLIVYTGNYGTGEPTVINTKNFIQNLSRIFNDDYVFTIIYVFIVIAVGLYLFVRYREILRKNKYYRLLVIIFISVTVQILIVAKHYSFHYMIPAHILIATSIFLIISIIKDLEIIPLAFIKTRLLTSAVILSGFLLVLRLIINYNFSPNLINPRKDTVDYINKYRCNIPVIIVNNRHGESAFIEKALFFGMSYAGTQKHLYGRTLKKRYPDTYFYNIGSGEFYDWQSTFPAFYIASRYHRIWLYFGRSNKTLKSKVLIDFSDIFPEYPGLIAAEKIYVNKKTGEEIYELSMDNNMVKSLIKVKREIILYSEAAELTDEHPYGPGIKIKTSPGEIYKVNAWRLSKEASGIIVATTDVPGGYYRTGASIQDVKGEWELVELNVTIPEYIKSDTLHIYTWNKFLEKEVYFDDFTILQLELKNK
jgi:hypothetical protein